MSQNDNAIEVAQSKTTTNYGVYDAPDGDEKQAIVGMYISSGITDDLGEHVTVALDTDGDGVPATLDRTTSGYGVFSTEADAIESMYVSHQFLTDLVEGDYDSDDSIESVGVTLSPSDEESFEEALDAVTVDEDETEQEAEALLAGSGGGDSEESGDEETVEIEDEELNLVDDE